MHKKKKSSLGNMFSSFFCNSNKKGLQSLDKSYRYKNSGEGNKEKFHSNLDDIRLLPMSIFPNMTTLHHYGLVDVNLIRHIYLHECDYQNAFDIQNYCNGAGEI